MYSIPFPESTLFTKNGSAQSLARGVCALLDVTKRLCSGSLPNASSKMARAMAWDGEGGY